VRHLKRFALEQAQAYRQAKRKLLPVTRGKTIGIVGSGPAGLTAARDLARLGYQVTIYDRHPRPGGMLALAIPSYRLPPAALNEDLEDILSTGVTVRTDCNIGRDILLTDLTKRHAACLIAVGLAQSRSLDIPGLPGPGVLLAIPFLEDLALGKKPVLSDSVLVIGGGNVAIDVARSARRLGASSVAMVCLENEEEMPAWKWEVEEALEEGITIHHRWGPQGVEREGDRVLGLTLKKVTAVFDSQGRFNPAYDEEVTSFLAAGTIIITIGQMTDLSLLNGSPVERDERGRPRWNSVTMMTNAPGIFMAGEVVTGPGSAIAAAASGHRAALAMHLYLEGQDIAALLPPEPKTKLAEIPREVAAKIACQSRVPIRHVSPEIRSATFDHFEFSFSEGEALEEAGRCRGCAGGAFVDTQKCMACLTCRRLCPYEAPVVAAYSEIRTEYCQACGLCVPECPAQAITMAGYDVTALRRDLPARMAQLAEDKRSQAAVAFLCTHQLLTGEFQAPPNLVALPVHCLSRVDVLDILKAFENGAQGVAIVSCAGDACKYREVMTRIRGRVKKAQDLLQSLEIEAARLELFTPAPGVSALTLAEEFSRKLADLKPLGGMHPYAQGG
jgi:NADPH-dependent glutamate synthase beta subunit-like oxidoreductase/coenzyme F420-reducing hydrogenase delta subunit/NAD-dependent dihydropyrimidine dehydrogenase PreA subunit